MREIYKEIGCEDVSFDPITAYGHGAADPHHVTDDSKGKRGDCVILDIGGFKDNYASDMTRTVFIGEVSDRAKEIYDIVLKQTEEVSKLPNREIECATLTLLQEITSRKKDLASISHTEQDILSDWKITNLVMYHLLILTSSRLDSASQ